MHKNTFGLSNLILIVFTIGIFLSLSSISFAQSDFAEDSDLDGISNDAELNTYKTNPNDPDTDKDGVLDYIEIVIDKTNPNDINSSHLTEISADTLISPRDPIVWYLSRITGIGAFIMFTMVISMGLLMTSKLLLKVRFLKAPDALQLHSFNASIVAFTLMLIHFSSLIFDDFIKLELREIFVPFILDRDTNSSLGFNLRFPVGFGVLAFYFASVLVITSQLRKKIVSIKVWRKLHYSSFIFYLLFLVHAIFAGTDTKEPWMIGIYVWSVTQVTALILLRIFGKKYFLPKVAPVSTLPTTGIQPTPKVDTLHNTSVTPKRFEFSLMQKSMLNEKVMLLKLSLINPSEITFTSGQFLNIKVNDKQYRSYSISSISSEKRFVEIIAAVGHEGVGANYFKNLKVGDKGEFIGPSGKFIIPQVLSSNLVFIATGTGISPLISMLRTLNERECKSNIQLIFGVRDQRELFLLDELKSLEKSNLTFRYSICFSQLANENIEHSVYGRVTNFIPMDNKESQYFICGNPFMVQDVTTLLAANQIPQRNIFHEKFTVVNAPKVENQVTLSKSSH